MNRKLLVILGPVAALVMFVGTVQMVSWFRSREYQGAVPRAFRDRRRHAARRGTGRRAGRRRERDQGDALQGGGVPDVPRRWEPRRHLGGRAAPPPVCGVRPCRPDLRDHRRGDRLQDGRQEIRPARARVREAALGVLLAHRDLRRGADVHAHHPVSEVHELPDERVLSDLFARTSFSSSRKPSSSTPTTTAGASSIPWSILDWGSASTSWAPRSCSSRIRGSRS